MQATVELFERNDVHHLLIPHDRNHGHEMRFGGGTGYCHSFESLLPRLRKLGVTEGQIEMIMVGNPERVFCK